MYQQPQPAYGTSLTDSIMALSTNMSFYAAASSSGGGGSGGDSAELEALKIKVQTLDDSVNTLRADTTQSFSDVIADIEDHVTALNDLNVRLNSNIDDLAILSNNVDTSMAALRADIISLTNTTSTLTTNLTTAQSKIVVLTTDLATARSDIETMKAQIATHTTDILAAFTKGADALLKANTNATNISNLTTRVQNLEKYSPPMIDLISYCHDITPSAGVFGWSCSANPTTAHYMFDDTSNSWSVPVGTPQVWLNFQTPIDINVIGVFLVCPSNGLRPNKVVFDSKDALWPGGVKVTKTIGSTWTTAYVKFGNTAVTRRSTFNIQLFGSSTQAWGIRRLRVMTLAMSESAMISQAFSDMSVF